MRTLVVLAALLPLLSFAAPDTAALDAWLKRQPSIQTVDADFVQERKLPALKAAVGIAWTAVEDWASLRPS